MARSWSRTRPRTAYTLVEMLVVLGLIAALAGLIVISTLAVRRKVDAVRCTANLLQIGIAIRMYMADYHATPLVYYLGARPAPPRPPSPPAWYDMQVALWHYLPDAATYYLPPGASPPPLGEVPPQRWGGGTEAIAGQDAA